MGPAHKIRGRKNFFSSPCCCLLEEASTGGELHSEAGLGKCEDAVFHFDFFLLFLVSIIHTDITFRIGEAEGRIFDLCIVLVLDRVYEYSVESASIEAFSLPKHIQTKSSIVWPKHEGVGLQKIKTYLREGNSI